MKTRRRSVSEESRSAAGRTLSERISKEYPAFGAAVARKGPVAVYLASEEEIDLKDFIASALSSGCALAAPRWNGGEYELVRLRDPDRLETGPHGISEPPAGPVVRPQEVRAWLVPGLAFTADGRRLGYGGGWYDRLLADAPDGVPKIGVAYDFQIVDSLPVEEHDIRMTAVTGFIRGNCLGKQKKNNE